MSEMEKNSTVDSVGTFEFNEENRSQGGRFMNGVKSANFYNKSERLENSNLKIKKSLFELQSS